MSIIGTLPNNIQNGQLEDATPVMANFNFIVNQVNANAITAGTLTAPAGTRMLFNQPAPPVGWTQETGAFYNDASMRIITGTAGGTNGSAGWTTWNFGGTFALNPFLISIAQLPAHSHSINDPTHIHSVTDPTHAHGVHFSLNGGGTSIPQVVGTSNGSIAFTDNTAGAATGVGINAASTGISVNNTGNGQIIQPSYTTPLLKYTDMLIGIKS
jgi:hypothetical protein